MILNKRISETPRQSLTISPRNADPFSNMIFKSNKSPILKPVCVKPKQYIMNYSKSSYNILGIKNLPPISLSCRKPLSLEIPLIRRNDLRTPRFSFPRVKKREIKSNSEIKFIDVSFGNNN